jgi:beta-glucanase (GH16 family)
LKKSYTLLAILIFFAIMVLTPSRFVSANSGDWNLFWSDEFTGAEGSGVDSTKWVFDIGAGGWGNHELEYYTDRTENASIQNNMLVIMAIKEDYNDLHYTSARLKTAGKFDFTYGKVEIYAKLPYGKGIWPAFWLLGSDINNDVDWPDCGEIDIMENIGKNTNEDQAKIYGTIHGPGYSSSGGIGTTYAIPNGTKFKDGFHKFSIEWELNVIRWYVDDIQYQRLTSKDIGNKEWVFNHNFFIILNLAVGGNWPGSPDNTTIFPQSYIIDYVRVYRRNDTGK